MFPPQSSRIDSAIINPAGEEGERLRAAQRTARSAAGPRERPADDCQCAEPKATRLDWGGLWPVRCSDGMDSPRNVRGIKVPTLP